MICPFATAKRMAKEGLAVDAIMARLRSKGLTETEAHIAVFGKPRLTDRIAALHAEGRNAYEIAAAVDRTAHEVHVVLSRLKRKAS